MIGITSWQVPGNYLENIKLFKDEVDFTELLVYTWNEDVKELLDNEMKEVLKIMKISVHLPTDSLENCIKAMNYFKNMDIFLLTMHPFGDIQKFKEAFEYGKKIYGERLCIENLEDGEFNRYYRVVTALKPSITMDYGHLLMLEEKPDAFFKRYEGAIKEIHYHGVKNSKGHTLPDEKQLSDFLKFLKKHKIKLPICIELFKLEDTLSVVKKLKNV